MKPHVERMIKEQVRLAEKIERLSVFISSNPIFQALPQVEKNDMCLQLQAMQMYNTLLINRICRAKSLDDDTEEKQVEDEKLTDEQAEDDDEVIL